ncbi:LAMI_0C00408g1_1 [Lachancea mirantina]|uniref:DNA replication complex GINS protein PSF3 n=1 Tax=Lachancea mirantina TaxID=1230905 RepID=A0A1G4J026_9SACH|nr:LAMI_0C00408g1_1 [Lachancea mirantina]
MSYYDIDDILADSTKVPCKFNCSVPGLGYLEGNAGHPIKKDSKAELPLWLARILAIIGAETVENEEEELPFVELMVPDLFSSRVLNAIKSSPTSLDVHSLSAHFYELAIKWATLFSDRRLVNVLNTMMIERAQEVNNHALSIPADSAPALQSGTFLLTLDEFEKRIFRDSHTSYKDMKSWMLRK